MVAPTALLRVSKQSATSLQRAQAPCLATRSAFGCVWPARMTAGHHVVSMAAWKFFCLANTFGVAFAAALLVAASSTISAASFRGEALAPKALHRLQALNAARSGMTIALGRFVPVHISEMLLQSGFHPPLHSLAKGCARKVRHRAGERSLGSDGRRAAPMQLPRGLGGGPQDGGHARGARACAKHSNEVAGFRCPAAPNFHTKRMRLAAFASTTPACVWEPSGVPRHRDGTSRFMRFMSARNTLSATRAPASRQTIARARASGMAPAARAPDIAQAAR